MTPGTSSEAEDTLAAEGADAFAPEAAAEAQAPVAPDAEVWRGVQAARLPPSRLPVRPRPRRRGLVARVAVAFVLGLVLVAALAVAGLYAYDQQYVHRVLPGVRIGQTDLSGLDEAGARQRLEAAYASLSSGEIAISVAGATTVVGYGEIGRRADLDQMVYDALMAGRDPSSPLAQAFGELTAARAGLTVEPRVVLDRDALARRIAEIARAAESDPVDADVVVTPSGYATTLAVEGRKVDVGSAVEVIATQLDALDAPSRVGLDLLANPVGPAVTDADAQLVRSRLVAMSAAVRIVLGSDAWTIPDTTVHSWISLQHASDGRLTPVIDEAAVGVAVAALKPLIDRPMIEATMAFQATGDVVKVTPSQEGRTFDAAATTAAVTAAVQARGQGGPGGGSVQAIATVTPPTLTTEAANAAAASVTMISTWTTNFQPAAHNGMGANIWVPTRKINGTVVGPGETFSFWKTVGEVSLATGYALGGAIIDGRTQEGVALGGGICSCSTTLFNAALRAGFKMGARLNHFYYISRYPTGLDATVFKGNGFEQDMTWTNDTDFPVLIRGITGPNLVRFDLYSVPNGRTVTFTDPVITNPRKATTKTIYTSALPPGRKARVEYADDGFDAFVRRTVTDASGAVIHVDNYTSRYARITGIIMVGKADADNVPVPDHIPGGA